MTVLYRSLARFHGARTAASSQLPGGCRAVLCIAEHTQAFTQTKG